MCLVSAASIFSFSTKPTICSFTCPPLKTSSVGMPRTPKRDGVAAFWSMFILVTLTLPLYVLASSSTMGAMALQGPHQGAQKSISTGASDFSTSCSKLASVTSMIPLDAITLSEKVDQMTSYHLAVQRLDAVGCG